MGPVKPLSALQGLLLAVGICQLPRAGATNIKEPKGGGLGEQPLSGTRPCRYRGMQPDWSTLHRRDLSCPKNVSLDSI